MPSPTFTFRLPQKDKAALKEMSLVYGAVSPGAFCSEMVGVMCSGDMDRVKAFNARLIKGMGEQLTLKLNAALDDANAADKPASQPSKAMKHVKGAVRRAKRV